MVVAHVLRYVPPVQSRRSAHWFAVADNSPACAYTVRRTPDLTSSFVTSVTACMLFTGLTMRSKSHCFLIEQGDGFLSKQKMSDFHSNVPNTTLLFFPLSSQVLRAHQLSAHPLRSHSHHLCDARLCRCASALLPSSLWIRSTVVRWHT